MEVLKVELYRQYGQHRGAPHPKHQILLDRAAKPLAPQNVVAHYVGGQDHGAPLFLYNFSSIAATRASAAGGGGGGGEVGAAVTATATPADAASIAEPFDHTAILDLRRELDQAATAIQQQQQVAVVTAGHAAELIKGCHAIGGQYHSTALGQLQAMAAQHDGWEVAWTNLDMIVKKVHAETEAVTELERYSSNRNGNSTGNSKSNSSGNSNGNAGNRSSGGDGGGGGGGGRAAGGAVGDRLDTDHRTAMLACAAPLSRTLHSVAIHPKLVPPELLRPHDDGRRRSSGAEVGGGGIANDVEGGGLQLPPTSQSTTKVPPPTLGAYFDRARVDEAVALHARLVECAAGVTASNSAITSAVDQVPALPQPTADPAIAAVRDSLQQLNGSLDAALQQAAPLTHSNHLEPSSEASSKLASLFADLSSMLGTLQQHTDTLNSKKAVLSHSIRKLLRSVVSIQGKVKWFKQQRFARTYSELASQYPLPPRHL